MRASRPTLLVVAAVPAVILGGCGSGAADSAALEDTEAQAPTAAADEHTEGVASADEHTDDAAADEHSEGVASADEHSDDAAAEDHASETFAFGEPAHRADADRTVRVRATDELAFEPAVVEVRAGEVITFEVENAGKLPHDFTLGDEDVQEEHAREMEEMGADMAHTDPNAMTIDPGETGSMTWRFIEPGDVLYGCHQLGHYDARMVGVIEVTP